MKELPPVFEWPSAKLVGAEIVGFDEATSTVELAFNLPPEFAAMRGTAQGGLLAGPIDEAFGAAVFLATKGKLQLSLDITLSFLRTVPMGKIIVKARAVKAGRRVSFLEGELFDKDGKLCVRSTATSMTTEWPGSTPIEGDG